MGDLNPTIRMRLERPEVDLFSPFLAHDATALAVMTLKRENIRTPKDLEGKLIASPESDAGRQRFPAFARAAGIDASTIRWQSVTPQLREPMLAQGRASAITGFITSGIFSLRGLGIAEPDIVTMKFSDVGADFYATSMITTRRFAHANPQAITDLIRGLVRAQYDSPADPAAAIANLRRREPLTNVELEAARLRMSLEQLTFTPHIRQNGFGKPDIARLQRSIDSVRAAFNISRPMAASDIYDPSFLPPASALKLA